MNAFVHGDFQTACDTIDAIRENFGEESAWTNGTLPKRLLPVAAYAEWRCGHKAKVLKIASTFLKRFPKADPAVSGFVELLRAQSLASISKFDQSAAAFAAWAEHHPDDPLRPQVEIQEAKILFQAGSAKQARSILDRLASTPGNTADRARLLAIQQCLKRNRVTEAAHFFFLRPWNLDAMPDLGTLAFTAIRLGDRLLSASKPGQAARCYRLVPSKQFLIEAQRRAISSLKQASPHRAASAASETLLQKDFAQARIHRLEKQLTALEKAPDYTPSLRLRLGQAFLLSGRPREAWLLFEKLAVDEHLSAGQREEAHYRWVLAAISLKRWEEALAIARSFAERFPKSPHAPQNLLLIAQAHLSQGRLSAAVEALTALINHFPKNPAIPRADFMRGYAQCDLKHFAQAHADFTACLQAAPNGPLAVNARLSDANTWFLQHRFNKALGILQPLASSTAHDPLAPEILFRLASTYYALRNNSNAAKTARRLLDTYPGSAREDDTRIVLGDALMAEGKLAAARTAFSRVSSSRPRLYAYAAFQYAKTLRAEHNYQGIITYFTAYLKNNTAGSPPPRAAEALLWIGHSYQALGKPRDSLPIFQQALFRFGNKPESAAANRILNVAAGLHQQLEGHAALVSWIAKNESAARRNKQATLYSRFVLLDTKLTTPSNDPATARKRLRRLFTEVPLQKFGPHGLGMIGLAFLHEPVNAANAALCLDRLEEHFPRDRDRAYGWFGQARLAILSGHNKQAIPWLARIAAKEPTHPVAVHAALLRGHLLLKTGNFAASASCYKALLGQRRSRGQTRAAALRGLAEAMTAEHKSAQAIAYYQRIYTLYRGYPDLEADAYLKSAKLFEARGNLSAAIRSLAELIADKRLAGSEAVLSARSEKQRLEALAAKQRSEEPQPGASS